MNKSPQNYPAPEQIGPLSLKQKIEEPEAAQQIRIRKNDPEDIAGEFVFFNSSYLEINGMQVYKCFGMGADTFCFCKRHPIVLGVKYHCDRK